MFSKSLSWLTHRLQRHARAPPSQQQKVPLDEGTGDAGTPVWAYRLRRAIHDEDVRLIELCAAHLPPLSELEPEDPFPGLGWRGYGNPERPDWPIRFAIWTGNIEVLKAVLNATVAAYKPPLGVALQGGHWRLGARRDVDILQTLVAHGADVNGLVVTRYDKRPYGRLPPLVFAVQTANVEVFDLLVRCGADINVRAPNGDGILHNLGNCGPSRAGQQIIATLIRAGANVNDRGVYDETPLHHLVWNDSQLTIAEMLLDAGADPNAQVSGGRTPLHVLAEQAQIVVGSEAVIDYSGAWQTGLLLVRHGANPSLRDRQGQTPRDTLERKFRGVPRPVEEWLDLWDNEFERSTSKA